MNQQKVCVNQSSAMWQTMFGEVLISLVTIGQKLVYVASTLAKRLSILRQTIFGTSTRKALTRGCWGWRLLQKQKYHPIQKLPILSKTLPTFFGNWSQSYNVPCLKRPFFQTIPSLCAFDSHSQWNATKQQWCTQCNTRWSTVDSLVFLFASLLPGANTNQYESEMIQWLV